MRFRHTEDLAWLLREVRKIVSQGVLLAAVRGGSATTSRERTRNTPASLVLLPTLGPTGFSWFFQDMGVLVRKLDRAGGIGEHMLGWHPQRPE